MHGEELRGDDEHLPVDADEGVSRVDVVRDPSREQLAGVRRRVARDEELKGEREPPERGALRQHPADVCHPGDSLGDEPRALVPLAGECGVLLQPDGLESRLVCQQDIHGKSLSRVRDPLDVSENRSPRFLPPAVGWLTIPVPAQADPADEARSYIKPLMCGSRPRVGAARSGERPPREGRGPRIRVPAEWASPAQGPGSKGSDPGSQGGSGVADEP